MKTGTSRGRRNASRALIVLVLGVLGAAAFLAVARVAGHHSKIPTVSSSVRGTPTALKGPHEPGELTAGGQENEIAARDNWFYGMRAFPSKYTPKGALATALHQTLANAHATRTDRAATTTWARVGPNPIATIGPDASSASGAYGGQLPLAGRVSAIAPAPSNINIVYAGGAAGGIWKSTNGGTSWVPAWPNSMASFSIGAIVVDPANPSNVWVGTGEANGAADSYYGQGIYHSTNGGASWVKSGGTNFDGCFISDMAFVSTTVVVAGVLEFPGNGNPACAQSKRGVWRTANGGSTWSKITLSPSAYQAPNDFTQPPGVPNTIYLATYIDGLYRSVNGGASWTKIANTTGYYREVVSAYNASTLYFTGSAGSSSADFGSLYKITNANTTPVFTLVKAGSGTDTACTYPAGNSGQCWYDMTVAADPTNINRAFVGGIRVFRFTGTTGVPIGYGGTTGKIHVDQHVTVFDASHNMWEGSDGGAYRLPVAQLGVSAPAFTNRNGSGSTSLGITEFNGWTSGSIAGGTFLGGTQDNGTVKYTSATGLNWRMDHGGDGGASAYKSANIYYASYYGSSVFKTLNGGSSYSQIFSSSDPAQFYPPMVQASDNADYIYRGTDRVFRTKTGSTFTAISPHYAGKVTAIGIGKTTSANAYAAWNSSPSQVRYSANATAASPTWTSVASGQLPNRVVTDFWVNPTTPTTAIATFSGFDQATPTKVGHVFRTTNGGATWTKLAFLPNVPVNAITADPANVNHLFIGTDTGVFYSANAGASWTNINGTTLPNTVVMDVRIDGSYLVAATHGRSAWKAVKP